MQSQPLRVYVGTSRLLPQLHSPQVPAEDLVLLFASAHCKPRAIFLWSSLNSGLLLTETNIQLLHRHHVEQA